MLKDGALEDILDSKFMIELMYRYISITRETELLKLSLLVSKDPKTFRRLMGLLTPWVGKSDPTEIFDKILQNEKFRSMEIPFGPQRSPHTELRL